LTQCWQPKDNFPANDLQQLATGSIQESDQAVRVLAEVCIIYPERNEAAVNAGVIALAREVGFYPGFARVVDNPTWNIGRRS
jgi:D-serine ammonia-lyase